MLNKLSLSILAGLLISILCGCSTQISPSERHSEPVGTGVATSEVIVVVTRDFGKEMLLEQKVEVEPDTTAMDALQMVARVETKYGGGFVRAINGISSEYEGASKIKRDWFFYINGIQSNTGALDYKLHDGDMQHWDFHDWSFHQLIPAIVGDFPEPFRYGYRGIIYPTIIVYQDGWKGDARRVADKLNRLGIENVSIRGINELQEDEKESCNLILLGTPDFPPIAELNQVWGRLGFYVHFQDGMPKVFDSRGEPAAEYGAGAGVIQATQSPWNPKGIGVCENTVWIVSGSDKTGVKDAVNTLVSQDNDFRYAYAVVIADGEVIRIP
jgi:hypothetical protein